MKNMIVWLFPILFMFHDFEEIIFIKPWTAKNAERLRNKYPALSEGLLRQFVSVSTSAFSLGVAEEFILISTVTIAAYLTGWYYLWLGGFIAFTLHLIAHCVQALMLKGYVPAFFTSILTLPLCCYCVVLFLQRYQPAMGQTIIFSVVGIVIMVVNLLVVHKAMTKFDRWLNQYQKL